VSKSHKSKEEKIIKKSNREKGKNHEIMSKSKPKIKPFNPFINQIKAYNFIPKIIGQTLIVKPKF
jgi:hypothetical protein